jgi:Fe2+ transport system protein FeoA
MNFTDGRPLRLSDLRRGDTARLHAADLDADTAGLLQAIGLTPASALRLCQAGNPCIVQVRETRIGLADAVAQRIFVVRDRAEELKP